jgi:hypothetical protein
MPIKRRTNGCAILTPRERFARAYRETLARYVREQPDEYAYTLDQVPIVVEKMVASLSQGRASLGPAVNAAARACGIKATQTAIRAYLNLEPSREDGSDAKSA